MFNFKTNIMNRNADTMQKHTTAIKEAYEVITDAYTSVPAIKDALNRVFNNVVGALNNMKTSELFDENEIIYLRSENSKYWNKAYRECMKISKESYTLNIKGE